MSPNSSPTVTSAQAHPQKSSSMKSIVGLMAVGGVLGGIGISLLMPKILSWWFEPPSTIGVSCAPSITWAIEQFRWSQLIGMGLGALLGLVVGIKYLRK